MDVSTLSGPLAPTAEEQSEDDPPQTTLAGSGSWSDALMLSQPVLSELREKRQNITKARSRVIRKRVRAHEMRNEQRYRRAELSTTEAELLDRLRAIFAVVDHKYLRGLWGHYHELQRARDDFGPLEDEYNQVENELDQEEYQLEVAEEAFYGRFQDLHRDTQSFGDLEPVARPNGNLTRAILPQPLGGHNSEVTGPSPIMVKYLTRLGNANLLKESLADLLYERSEVLQEEETRRSHGLPLPSNHAAFWEGFDQEWIRGMEELAEVETEVMKLRQQAQKEGVLSFNIRDDSSDEAPISKILEPPIPTLTGREEGWDPVVAVGGPNQRILSTRQRVNQWFLLLMNTSHFEMWLHRAQTELDRDSVDEETYVKLVKEDMPTNEDEVMTMGYLSSTATSEVPLPSNHALEATMGVTTQSATGALPGLEGLGRDGLQDNGGEPTGSVRTGTSFFARDPSYLWSRAHSV